MDVFEQAAYTLVTQYFGLGGAAADAAAFFIYDTAKVFLLLALMIFAISILRTYITRERIKKMLGGRTEGIGNLMAACLGILTPFCSCSAVPLFIGFLEAGVPLGITFSFLIACPMINEVAIALLWGLVGWEITLLYIVSGLAVSVVAGIAIGRLKMEGEVEKFAPKCSCKKAGGREEKMPQSWKEKIAFAKGQVGTIVGGIWAYVVVGIGIGALIHGYVPVDFFASIAGPQNPLAVIIVVLAGIPMYSNAAGTIPIVEALMQKGMALGTALAFMMSITALSLPEIVILRRVLKPKLLAAFVGIMAVSIVLIGFLFNAIL
jgi:uncharacterized membrane protein YraQ (UPF0718 family)